MKALLINASPRGAGSNTLLLAQAFLRGLACETETVTLADCTITPCTGCMTCWKRGDGKCVFSDSMPELLEKVMAADIIIESFPLYYFGMPTLLKAFTDRTFCLMQPYHGQTDTGCAFQTPRDARLREKKLVLISTCGYASAEWMYEALLKQYDLLCHGRNYTPIFCPEGELMQVEQLAIPRRRLLSRLEEAGREYARQLSLPEQTLRLLQTPLVDPRVYQIIADAHWSGAKGESREEKQ